MYFLIYLVTYLLGPQLGAGNLSRQRWSVTL